MFDSCINVKRINLKSFNTKNAVNMFSMFLSCMSLNQLDLSSFDFNNVKINCIFDGINSIKVILKKKYKNIFHNLYNKNIEIIYI